MGTKYRYGAWVVGDVRAPRRLVETERLLVAAAELGDGFVPSHPQYASVYAGAGDYRRWFDARGTDAQFAGAVWCPWFVLDYDSADSPGDALATAARLCGALQARAGVDADSLRLMFSGAKGGHVVLPARLIGIEASADCPARCGRFAARLTAWAAEGDTGGVAHDAAMHHHGRLCRLANSRHPRTRLHRVLLPTDEFFLCAGHAHLLERARALAQEPHAFEWLEQPDAPNPTLLRLWREACADATQHHQKRAAAGERCLTRATREFMTDGAPTGERHSRLFSAAAALSEAGAPAALVWELLREPALDSGLAPAEVRKTVADGIAHAARQAVQS